MPTLREIVQTKIASLEIVKDKVDKAITLGKTWLDADAGIVKPRFNDIPETAFTATAQEINGILNDANARITEAKTELAKV